MSTPHAHSKAPLFSLPDESGKIHALSNYKGTWVLLYFYPKDDTPGCTQEACVLRDNFPHFEKLNTAVIGISADSTEKHIKFKTKYNLPFTLLSDTTHITLEAYGVWQKKKFMGREYMGIMRTSFLIDPKGNIAEVYEHVTPRTHADEVIQDLKRLQHTS